MCSEYKWKDECTFTHFAENLICSITQAHVSIETPAMLSTPAMEGALHR